MLRDTAAVTGSVVARNLARLIVPLIVVAEICSWYAVLTTANIGHVIEESLWGVSALLVVGALVAFYPRLPARWHSALIAAVVAGVLYAAYMFLVDVPMYWSRWIADQAQGREYLNLGQGVVDMFERRIISHRWEDWSGEMLWMSLYFSVAVWISISLVHATLRREGQMLRSGDGDRLGR